ncbi:MAG TPA: C1 family peptidase [Polyangiales bacterium]|nr:C1 family peptidase [Polyangiales bacterium]
MPRRTVRIADRTLALDARPDRLDIRDRPFQPQLVCLPARWPHDADVEQLLPDYVKHRLIRDQGQDGACTGFGLAAVIDYLHFVLAYETAALPESPQFTLRRGSPAMLYELARLYDEWPGEDYEGSSCRGALKGWHRHGVCREELWPYKLEQGKHVFVPPEEHDDDRDNPQRNWDLDAMHCVLGVYYRIDARSVVDMQAAIRQVGAIYCSGNAHEGWEPRSRPAPRGHDDLPEIKHIATPRQPGGHAFALVGYNERGFVLQNSWGESWGACGFALLPYADWVAHGQDAWVFTLGVPALYAARKQHARSPRYVTGLADPVSGPPVERPAGLIGGSDTLERRYRDVPAELQPLTSDRAYRHAVVLDRGFPVRNDITREDAYATMECVGYELPRAWLEQHKSNKLLVYAHGGLNSEADSITRIRAFAPYALEAGIYPLFISWRSGPLETIDDLAFELFAKLGFGPRGVRPAGGWLDQLTDRTDRMLEPVLRGPGGALWHQMKTNAERTTLDPLDGFSALVQQLARLQQARPATEIHLIGHSAGSIVTGTLLDRMRDAKLRARSLRLFAPACSIDFALAHYKPAVESKQLDAEHFHIHNLSNRNELNGSVGPYQKSLLYLVSRSFEAVHKTALLGLDRAFDRATTLPNADDDTFGRGERAKVAAWLDFWQALGHDASNRLAHVLEASRVSTGAGNIPASHGCFDNAVEILGDALGYIVNPLQPKRVKIHRLDY